MDKIKSLTDHLSMILSYDFKLRSLGKRNPMAYQNLTIVVTLCCPPPPPAMCCPLEVCPWGWESGLDG